MSSRFLSLSALLLLYRPENCHSLLRWAIGKSDVLLHLFQLVGLSWSGIAGWSTKTEVPVRWRSEREPFTFVKLMDE
jgi:hypothetical protein